MNRKPRPQHRPCQQLDQLSDWRQRLFTRRQLLIAAAAGSLAAVFPQASVATAGSTKKLDPWPLIDAVQQQLFPNEDHAPGAREINALGYLKFVVSDTTLAPEDREFITRGAAWLEDMAQQMYKKSFLALSNTDQEKVLQRIAASEAGENWLSTLLLYIVEALLTDPVYGGNTQQRGWTWLQHVPGFPRPPLDKTFPRLLS
jgi:gluconate 2-dehydrogenase gamma chain